MAAATAHHGGMIRGLLLSLLLLSAAPTPALERLELSIGRVDGGRWQLRDVAAALRLDRADPGRLRLEHARLVLEHNSADGRLAAEDLRVAFSGETQVRGDVSTLTLQAHADGGLAYFEPFFVDFAARPLRIDAILRHEHGELRIERFDARQRGVGALAMHGDLAVDAWKRQHRLQIDARIEDAAVAASIYAQPALTATPLQGLRLDGALSVVVVVEGAGLRAAEAQLQDLAIAVPGRAVEFGGVHGRLHWSAAAPARGSQLHWDGGRVGRIPLGPAQIDFETAGGTFALNAPARIPVLDGGIEIERLSLAGLGGADLQADFAARLQPINLAALCRALDWPTFSGTLSGRIPGLQLRDRRLVLEGALTASAFDGTIRVGALQVIEPLGVLPRVHADIRLRRLDLAALTGAFDFGRISGRLDGDIDGLRLVGWAPVAMDAHLYSTPGDRTRKRISQRAIDNISAVGGGPTGLLSRGILRFFDDFAYRRIGWRCALDNGVCRMDGIRPSDDGDGYVLVEGSGLPRIDVVGFSRRVSWPVFIAQLRSIGSSGPARVD